jgi:tetratricopeptide (TPR) repeat protein
LRLRPGAATHVLIGRTWRDYEHFEQAERELHLALRLDPTARRANYYLGTILVRRPDGLKDAIVAFQRELEITPDDYLSTLNAGIALTADRRAREAVPLLRRAWQMNPKEVRPLYHLGQAQFQAGDAAGAVDSLDRYLEAASKDVNTLGMVGSAEYVLAQSLHSLGRDSEAAAHFERAKDLKEKYRAESQDQLQQYLASDKQSSPEGGMGQTLWRIPAEPNVPAQAEQARAALSDIVARAYFNLGVILSQRSHFPAAAASFYRASRWEPGFPRVDAALGTARFQAAQYEPAIEPLKKALAQEPTSTDISRLLALACFQAKSYRCAAQMLEHDPRVESDPAMEYALGVSLVNVGQPAQAAEVFSRLIERNQGSADLYVLLGNAHAQQDDYEEALKQFDRALQLDPKVREANLSAGLVLLRQGKLPEAERRFRAELASDPKSTRASYHLAYVLTLQQKGTEAVPLLRGVLKQNPALADARYLLGQTLLEQGDTAAAVEQLEASVRLAPGEARSHYQLGRAYQKLGRSEEAQQQFALFQKLKQPEKKE